MKTALYLLSVTSVVALAIACSDADSEFVPDSDDSGATQPDASTSVPLPDAAPTEGGDTNVDVDADAATDGGSLSPRTCSVESWCPTVVPDAQLLNAVWGDGEGNVWTVSNAGRILRWDGTAWVQSYPESSDGGDGQTLKTIWGSGPTDLWAGGSNVLLHGTGASPATITWSVEPMPVFVELRSIWGTSASDIWAVGYTGNDFGYVFRYGGASWTVDPVSTELPMRFTKVWGTGPDDVWLGGVQGNSSGQRRARVLRGSRSESGSYTWMGTDLPGSYFNGAFSVSRSDVYLLGCDDPNTFSTYLKGYCRGVSNDEGASFTWTRHVFDYVNTPNFDAWGTGPKDVYMVGDYGRLRHWDGATWQDARTSLDDVIPVIRNFRGIWGSGPGDVWVVGDRIALHKVAP